MNKENKTWERDFIPHVHPPMKNKTKNNCCFAFRDRKLLLLRDKNGPRVPSVQEIESIDADIKQMLYLGEFSQILGFIAIVMASVNLVGGFVVTDRMLRMFTKRVPKGNGGDEV